ncbi:unnamed protein product, partial [Prorocentrum cordatum]
MLKPFHQRGWCVGSGIVDDGQSLVLVGAASNLLAAWISRAPPCPAAPAVCPNLTCGAVQCRASEQPLTCLALAPAAPPPAPTEPSAEAPEPPPPPVQAARWDLGWLVLPLVHVAVVAVQLGQGAGLASPPVGNSDPLDLLISIPDRDVYQESYAAGSPDIVTVVFPSSRQALQGVGPDLLHRFRREPNVAEATAIGDALEEVAQGLYFARERAGGRPLILPVGGACARFDFANAGAAAPGGPAAATAPVGAGGGAAAAALAGVMVPVAAGAPPPAAALPISAGCRGDVVNFNGSEKIEGDIALSQQGVGWVAIRRIFTDHAAHKCAESGAHIRLLGVAPRADGHHVRLALREVVPPMVENAIPGWLLDGPRAVLWCAQIIDRKRLGHVEHISACVAFFHLTKDDCGVSHCGGIMKMIEHLGCRGQLDPPDLVGVELTTRQAQLHECIYSTERDALQAEEAGGGTAEGDGKEKGGRGRGGGPHRFGIVDEAALFTGAAKEDDRSMICPRLLEHVSRQKRFHPDGMVSEMTDALNEMRGCPLAARGQATAGSSMPSAGHAQVFSEPARAALRFGPSPDGFGGPGALEELRISQSCEGDATMVALVSFDHVDSITLPRAGSHPTALEVIDKDVGLGIVRRLHELRLPRQLGLERVSGFARALPSAARASTRRIRDGRHASSRFNAADPVELATGAAFAQISVGDDQSIALGGVDISDAFYSLGAPPWLRHYFGLSRLRAGDVGLGRLTDGAVVKASALVVPRSRFSPMGWSIGLWICQSLNEAATARAIPGHFGRRLVDRRPAPSLLEGLAHAVRVDNSIALSHRLEEVRGAAARAQEEMTASYLPAHFVEVSMGGDAL